MDINLKHIFKSDLDPNSTSWWSADKIDKFNYNFGLLTLGGPDGPQGRVGANGSVGYPGESGSDGPIGFDGAQGAYGISGAEPWKKVKNIDADFSTILPKYNGLPEDEVDVTRVIFSDYISGYTDTDGDGEMDSGDILITENSPVDFYDAIWGIYTHDPNLNNLEFRSSDNNNKGIVDLYSDGINDFLEFYSDLQINIGADRLSFNDYEKTVNWLKVDELEFNVSNNILTSFDDEAKAVTGFKYQNNPVAGYILTSINNSGDVEWKDKLDIFDGLPIGSVVSIPCEYFNSDNFHLNEILPSYQSNQNTLFLKYGRGKDKFKGWYLCNGKTWSNSTVQYSTPNLNSFTYSISSNGNGQIAVSDGNDTAIIIGGAKAYVAADLTPANEYETTIDITTTDVQISLGSGSGYYRSRNIHIVYLKSSDLTWFDNVVDTGQGLEGVGGGSQSVEIQIGEGIVGG
jgi:hypothetical protein